MSARKKAAKKPSATVNAVRAAMGGADPKRFVDAFNSQHPPRVADREEQFVAEFGEGEFVGLRAAIHAIQCAGADALVREQTSDNQLFVYAIKRAPA